MDAVIDVIVRVGNNVPLDTVLQALAAAGVLAMIVQKLKNWFEVQSSAVLNVLNFLLASVVVMIQGLLSATAQNPTLIPQEAASLFALTIAAYHAPYIGIKALSNLIADVKGRKEQKARAALKHSNEVVEEVPIESVVPQVITPVVALEVAADTPVAVAPVPADEFGA